MRVGKLLNRKHIERNVVGVVARKNTFYAEMLLFFTLPSYPLQFPQHVLEVMVFYFCLVH